MKLHCSDPYCESCLAGTPCRDALCPECLGDCMDGCAACNDTGWATAWAKNRIDVLSGAERLTNELYVEPLLDWTRRTGFVSSDGHGIDHREAMQALVEDALLAQKAKVLALDSLTIPPGLMLFNRLIEKVASPLSGASTMILLWAIWLAVFVFPLFLVSGYGVLWLMENF